MEDPIKLYPNLKVNSLFDKGDYLEYYQKRNSYCSHICCVIMIEPKKILERVKKMMKSFVLKPHRAYANIGIGKFDKNKYLLIVFSLGYQVCIPMVSREKEVST